MSDLPLVMSPAGLQPQLPADIRAQLINKVGVTNPDYTANLPGSMIEDIVSTDIAAIVLSNSFLVDLVNSITPLGANPFLLAALGYIYGVQPGEASNTSVYITFTGPPGWVITKGFIVSDGTYQYICQDGGIIGSDNKSLPLFAVATQSGSWAVPVETVNQLITSVPSEIQPEPTCRNEQVGIPATFAESQTSFRTRCLTAGLAASMGMTRFLKTLVSNVIGVQSRLISVRQKLDTAQWELIVGGGDPYQVAGAIYHSLFDIQSLTGSTFNVTGITKANPGVVTIDLNHGYETGEICRIHGIVGMTALNDIDLTVTVTGPKTFSIGINTSGYSPWISGGVVTPNNRNILVSINDYPDTYQIPFVNPPQELVAMTVSWKTNSPNYVSATAMAAAAQPALVDYINNLYVGSVPINIYEMQTIFQDAVKDILPAQSIIILTFAVSINGIGVSPTVGTGIIEGDPESYFYTTLAGITVTPL